MNAMRQFFLVHIYRSDASISWRWALCLCLTLALMPTFGSVLSFLMIGMSFVAWTFLFFDLPRYRLETLGEKVIVSAFLAYAIVSVAMSQLHENRLAGIIAMNGVMGFVAVLPLIPVVRSAARDYWEQWISVAIGCGGVIVGIVVLLIPVPQHGRAMAFVGNPQILTYIAGSTGLFCLCLFLFGKAQLRLLFLFGVAGSVTAMLFAGGRAGLAYFALNAAGLVILRLMRLGHFSWRQWFLLIYVCICGAAIAYEAVDDTAAFSNFAKRSTALVELFMEDSEGGAPDQSFALRQQMAKAGWSAVVASPVFGYGRQNMMKVANAQFDDDLNFPFTHLHNAFLTEWVSSGIFGLISYIFVLFVPAIASWNSRFVWSMVGLSSTLFTLMYSISSIGFFHDIKVLYFCAVVIFLNALASLKSEMPRAFAMQTSGRVANLKAR